MIVGFTGTRRGMSAAQNDSFYRHLSASPLPTVFHHGACKGADEQAVEYVANMLDTNGGGCRIVAWPCEFRSMQSRIAIDLSDEVNPELPALIRNSRIVDACQLLIACPEGSETLRSGTWSTVRKARARKKQIAIIWPDGTVTEENKPVVVDSKAD